MKFFGLVLALFVLNISKCWAANRSVMWVIGNQQVYTPSLGYQTRARMASTLTTIFSGDFMGVNGSDTLVKDNNGIDGTTAVFTTLYLGFKCTGDCGSTPVKIYQLNDASQALSNVFGSGNTTVLTSSGSAWLTIQVSSPTITGTTSYSIAIISDTRSSSSISITQWCDTSSTPNIKFYMFMLYTSPALLSSSSGTLATTGATVTTKATTTAGAGGSSSSSTSQTTAGSGRKRRFVEERGASSCGVSSSAEQTIQANQDAICDNLLLANSKLGSALTAAVAAAAQLKAADSIFSAASSQFTMTSNLAALTIAISSLIFRSLFN